MGIKFLNSKFYKLAQLFILKSIAICYCLFWAVCGLWLAEAFTSTYTLELWTGTWYIVIPLKWLQYQNCFFHSCLSNTYFDMFSGQNALKVYEIFIFWSEVLKNLTVTFCCHVNCTLPIFCAYARLSQRARIQEISCW